LAVTILKRGFRWLSIEIVMILVTVWLMRRMVQQVVKESCFENTTVRLLRILSYWSFFGCIVSMTQVAMLIPNIHKQPAAGKLLALYFMIPPLSFHLVLGIVFFALSWMITMAAKIEKEQSFTV